MKNPETYRVEYHSHAAGGAFRNAYEILKRAIESNALKIELVDCDWSKIKEMEEKILKLETAIKLCSGSCHHVLNNPR